MKFSAQMVGYGICIYYGVEKIEQNTLAFIMQGRMFIKCINFIMKYGNIIYDDICNTVI